MNCISNLYFQYRHFNGLRENVDILSFNLENVVVQFHRTKCSMRVPLRDIIIIRDDYKDLDLSELKIDYDCYIYSNESYCPVKVVEISDSGDVVVKNTNNLLFNEEENFTLTFSNIKQPSVYYEIFDMDFYDIIIPIQYSRYFINNAIYKPLLKYAEDSLIVWSTENLSLRVYSLNEKALQAVKLLEDYFIKQLYVLMISQNYKRFNLNELNSCLVWEYLYEDEKEANFAIGQKGEHISAVRSIEGIVGVGLMRNIKLRIISQSVEALKLVQSILCIERESYMFDNSLIPLFIGKQAANVTDLISKTGLHCIHVPNSPHIDESSIRLPDLSLIVKTGSNTNIPSANKRQLILFGTRQAINSAKLLMEVEESVKELRLEFENKRNCFSNNPKSSSSIMSSMSSISKDQSEINQSGDVSTTANNAKKRQDKYSCGINGSQSFMEFYKISSGSSDQRKSFSSRDKHPNQKNINNNASEDPDHCETDQQINRNQKRSNKRRNRQKYISNN